MLGLICFLTGCMKPDFVSNEVRVTCKRQNENQRQAQSATYTFRFTDRDRYNCYYDDQFELPDNFAQVGQIIIVTNGAISAIR